MLHHRELFFMHACRKDTNEQLCPVSGDGGERYQYLCDGEHYPISFLDFRYDSASDSYKFLSLFCSFGF